MSNASRITYLPLPDATPERELDTLAAVYRFILDGHMEKKAAEVSGGEKLARKESTDVSRNRTISQP